MKSILEQWVEGLYTALYASKWSRVFVMLILLASIFFATQLNKLSFNYNIESFFSNEDPEVAVYEEFKTLFGNENNALLIGIDNKNGVFKQPFLARIDSLSKVLGELSEIRRVLSPTSLKEYMIAPIIGMVPIPLIHIDQPERYISDSTKIYSSGIYTGSIFSKTKPCITVGLEIIEELDHAQNEKLLSKINMILSLPFFELGQYHLAGRIQTQHYYIKTMKKEMLLFSLMALLLFCISLWVTFKNYRYVIIPLTVVFISLIWIFGIMSLLSIQVDLMLTIMPTLIFVLSTSVAIHFLSKFKKSYLTSGEKENSIKAAFIDTTIPNALISITTAAGLGSLYFIPVDSIQKFGLLSSASVLISLAMGLIFIPHLINLFSISSSSVNHRDGLPELSRIIISILFSKAKRFVVPIYIMIILIGVIGVSMIKINNNFLDDLNNKSVLKKDLVFFENEFSGVRPFELLVRNKADSGTMLNHENIKALDTLEQYVETNYQLGMIQSPVLLMKMLNKAVHGGNHDYFNIPQESDEYNALLKKANRYHIFERSNGLLTKDKQTARISGRLADYGSAHYSDKNKQFNEFANANDEPLEVRLTGVAYLIDKANGDITRHFMAGLALVIIVVALVITFYSNSIPISLLALVVNIIPLLIAGAVMGFIGFPLKISTALIFTIVLGIATDDTIHFLHHYLSMRKKYPSQTAVKLSLKEMLSPILSTTLVLFSGFMIFTLSSFEGIQVLGWLTSISLIVAMLTDLLLLPILLLWVAKYTEQFNPSLQLQSLG